MTPNDLILFEETAKEFPAVASCFEQWQATNAKLAMVVKGWTDMNAELGKIEVALRSPSPAEPRESLLKRGLELRSLGLRLNREKEMIVHDQREIWRHFADALIPALNSPNSERLHFVVKSVSDCIPHEFKKRLRKSCPGLELPN